MRLRIFLPAAERLDAQAPLPWILLERRGVLRSGESPLGEMPRGDEIEAILPAARVLFARLKLPRVNAATIRELLPFAIEDRLLADPSHVHAVAGGTDARGETIVAVIDRGWLSHALRALADARFTPRRAWSESDLLPHTPGEWHAVLRPESGLLVDDAGVAGTFDWASDSPAPLALRLALDEASARGERPARVHVHADRTALPDLARWSAECSVPLEPAQPWNEIAAQDPAAGAIELLTDAFAPRRSRIKSLRIPRAAMFVALAIALTQFGLTAADAWRLERERSALEARREAIFRTAFPEARAVVDPDLQMARNLAQLRRERGLDTADAFVTALGAAARESSTPAQSLDYANGRLTVRRAGSAR